MNPKKHFQKFLDGFSRFEFEGSSNYGNVKPLVHTYIFLPFEHLMVHFEAPKGEISNKMAQEKFQKNFVKKTTVNPHQNQPLI